MRENTHTHIQDISRRIANELGFRKGDVLKVLKKFTKEILIEVYEGKPCDKKGALDLLQV